MIEVRFFFCCSQVNCPEYGILIDSKYRIGKQIKLKRVSEQEISWKDKIERLAFFNIK